MIVTRNNIQFEVMLEGPEEAPVITLSHSLSTSLRAWDDLVAVLVPTYRVLRYSMRGHGKTDVVDGPYSLEELAADIVAIQDHFGIRKSHLIGLSIGGVIAQTYALTYPERLGRLVIASSLCQLPEGADGLWKDRIAAVKESGIEGTVEPTIERWFSADTRISGHPAIERTRAFIRQTSIAGYVGCCHAISKLDLKDRLPTIEAPTLVIVGREDMGTPVAASDLIHQQIPGSDLLVIDSASHQVAMERPDEFNSAILDFLND